VAEQWHYVQHISHMDWPRNEHKPPSSAAGDWPPEPRYGPQLINVYIDLDVSTLWTEERRVLLRLHESDVHRSFKNYMKLTKPTRFASFTIFKCGYGLGGGGETENKSESIPTNLPYIHHAHEPHAGTGSSQVGWLVTGSASKHRLIRTQDFLLVQQVTQ
jgi:hypothetical protein